MAQNKQNESPFYTALTIETTELGVDLLSAALEIVGAEKQEIIERREWTWFSHRIIFHGRRVCHSRRAACGACFLAADCPSYGLAGPAEPETAEKLIKSPDRGHLLAMAGLGDEQREDVTA